MERWIEKRLPAVAATKEQLGALVAAEWISSIPPHGVVYLIREMDLVLIPQIRAYPKGTTRGGKKRGMSDGGDG